jgi:hypothetical protein
MNWVSHQSQAERIRGLEQSTDAAPVVGTVDIDVRVDRLWESFRHAHLWPRWNRCFCWVKNDDLVRGDQLIWVFEPIKPWYVYRLPAVARIVELEPQRKVTWEVTALPGMYARHTYFMEDLGSGRTRFGSWEKAMGPSFRVLRSFWMAHFWFVNRESLAGARRLGETLCQQGAVDERVGLRDA